MLSDRRQIVLRMLIEEYIARALPVGSRTLVERYNLGFSTATIRNDLSYLEDAGYLTQPHTSAGRVPTDSGYRAFVDDLLASLPDSEADKNTLDELLQSATELDLLAEKASSVLSRLTDCLATVIPPRTLDVTIKVINLISLADSRLLLVIVTEGGQVFNRQIELSDSYTDDQIIAVQTKVNSLLTGTLVDVPFLDKMIESDARLDSLLLVVLKEVRLCLKQEGAIKPCSLGMANLLGQPEFSNSACLLPVLEQLEDDTLLLHVLDEAMKQDDPLVRIGHENETEALSSVSLVASRYGTGKQMGLVVVMGPTRMNYSQVLRAVRAAKSVLQDQ